MFKCNFSINKIAFSTITNSLLDCPCNLQVFVTGTIRGAMNESLKRHIINDI